MAHPEWALKHKVKGTELRNRNGRYYLYKISSYWDKDKKRTVKSTDLYLGRITKEDGLIPKGQRGSSEKPKVVPKVLEYGATHILKNLGEDIIQVLKEKFPNDWESVYVLAVLKLVYGRPFKNMEELFNNSYLSVEHKDLKLSKNRITAFLQSLGKKDDAMISFQKEFLKHAKHIAFDVSHIISNSKKMNINFQGYNSKRDFDPQVNALYLFSTDIKMPAYYRILPGNISGVKALKLTIDEAGLQDCTVIGDKGFYSNANVIKLEKSGLSYVLPMRRNSTYAQYSRLKSREYSEAYDGHFIHKKRPIYYYTYKHNERNCIMFYDQLLEQSEAKDYLLRLEAEKKGYSIKGFEERQLAFGTMLVITNIEDPSPEDIYQKYKTRMEVETMFDALKNILEADSSYMQSDEAFKAWMFINHIALMLYYRLYNLLRKKDLLKSLSPKDILLALSSIYKVRIKKSWQLSEVTSKTDKMLKKLKLAVT